MAAGADSMAVTRAATAASPATPEGDGSGPGLTLIFGQQIPAMWGRQPHDRQTWDRGVGHGSGRIRPGYRTVGGPGPARPRHGLLGDRSGWTPRLDSRARRDRRSGRRMVDSRGALAHDGRRAE